MQSNHNRVGIAQTAQGKRLVRVEYEDTTGFFFVRDIETNVLSRVYRHYIDFMPFVPSRFKEAHFQSVANIWGDALLAYPKTITVSSIKYSTETLARKLREAREAKRRYKYESHFINEELWRRFSDEISIEINEKNELIVGSKQEKKQNKEVESIAVTIGKQQIIVNVSAEFSKIEQLCLLLHERAFNPAPVFVLTGLTDEQAVSLESRYDVALSKENDTWMIL